MAEGERRQQAELLQLRREHSNLEEAHGRSIINLAEVREKLAMSEINASRFQAQSARSTALDGGAVSQLHALKIRVTGRDSIIGLGHSNLKYFTLSLYCNIISFSGKLSSFMCL